MRKLLTLFCLSMATANASDLSNVPLHKMTCTGPFVHNFFMDLTPRSDLNEFISKLGKHPDTVYKFELFSDVFTSRPTFNGGHTEEYVFLSTDDEGLSVSRFAILNNVLFLLAQHPANLNEEQKILKYRQSNLELPPDWTCQY